MPFTQLKIHPDLLRGVKDLGFQRPTPIQADAIPPAVSGRDLLACAHDGQRQDRRLSSADSQRPDGEAAQSSRHDPRPDSDADARARRADHRRPERPRRPHAAQRLRRLRRRRHGPAGARLPQRRRCHRRHAGPSARSFPPALREARRPRVSRARRSGPDARHGIPPGHPPRAPAHSREAPDAVFQRDDAGPDRQAVARDAARTR